jgi:hypothetical protein
MNLSEEYVIKSAILYNNRVYAGKRHGDIIPVIINETGVNCVNGEQQGFITSSGRFVNRREAAKIALESGQIRKLRFHEDELFSEDLY